MRGNFERAMANFLATHHLGLVSLTPKSEDSQRDTGLPKCAERSEALYLSQTG